MRVISAYQLFKLYRAKGFSFCYAIKQAWENSK